MARVDAPISYTQWMGKDGKPSRWFYQFIQSLWEKTGGSSDFDLADDVIPYVVTTLQLETAVSYTITGTFDHEIVTCTNTTAITITMPTHVEDKQVTVIRGGTGAVTIAGNGTNIVGSANQTLPLQHDAAHMFGKVSEWGLR